tara:strand:- start:1862 stop:2191 length:330 start_codon:yes stop_codon:yes gene_type:complete
MAELIALLAADTAAKAEMGSIISTPHQHCQKQYNGRACTANKHGLKPFHSAQQLDETLLTQRRQCVQLGFDRLCCRLAHFFLAFAFFAGAFFAALGAGADLGFSFGFKS